VQTLVREGSPLVKLRNSASFLLWPRSVLRHIRVTSKHELKERIMAGIDDVNRHPVIHTWSYTLADAPDMIRTKETLT
jgi:hypothetical protein